ncbi:MAG: hypothetical protein R3C10_17895 [Pirellulales bacterium]
MKSLMIHVERAVRPVRATEDTKCRMREELFAHIEEIYHEELTRTGDANGAILRSCERFGDPAELTIQLQQTVFWLERVGYPLIVLFNRREHESAPRHAMRAAASNLAAYLIFGGVVGVVSMIVIACKSLPIGRSFTEYALLSFQIIAAPGLWESVGVGLFALIGPRMAHQVERGLLRPKSWWTVGWLSVAAVVIVFVCGAGFLLMMPIGADDVEMLLPRWLLLALVTPTVFAVVCRMAAMEAVRSRPWVTLDLSH